MSALRRYEDELRQIAFHEAGHVAIDTVLGIKVQYVTIVPDPPHSLGCCQSAGLLPAQVRRARMDLHARKSVLAILAGPIALWHFQGVKPTPRRADGSDAKAALALAWQLYPGGSEADRGQFLGLMGVVARALVTDAAAWKAIQAVSASLLRYKTLTPPMLDAVLHEALPDTDKARLRAQGLAEIRRIKAVMAARPPREEKDTAQ